MGEGIYEGEVVMKIDHTNVPPLTEANFPPFKGGQIPSGYDPVKKPAHYNMGDGIECIDYIKQVLGPELFVGYCHGNLIKYQHRYKYKQKQVEDMEKAQWYLDKMVETLKEIHK